MPEGIQATINEIKQAWKSREFESSALALARNIRAKLLSEGYEVVGISEVRRWLTSD